MKAKTKILLIPRFVTILSLGLLLLFFASCKKNESPILRIYESITPNRDMGNNDSVVFKDVTYFKDTSIYFTLMNYGNAPLYISNIEISGTNATDYSILDGYKKVINPNSAEKIYVVFHLKSSGTKFFNLEVVSNDSDYPKKQVCVRMECLPSFIMQDIADNIFFASPTYKLNDYFNIQTPDGVLHLSKYVMNFRISNNGAEVKIVILNKTVNGQDLEVELPYSSQNIKLTKSPKQTEIIANGSNQIVPFYSNYNLYNYFNLSAFFTNQKASLDLPSELVKVDTEMQIYVNKETVPIHTIFFK